MSIERAKKTVELDENQAKYFSFLLRFPHELFTGSSHFLSFGAQTVETARSTRDGVYKVICLQDVVMVKAKRGIKKQFLNSHHNSNEFKSCE